MANVNYYTKDWLNNAVDNEIEYLVRGYGTYLAGSNQALSRKEIVRVFLKRLHRKDRQGASQEPFNLRARLDQAGFIKAHG
jgi:hypothetical protein